MTTKSARRMFAATLALLLLGLVFSGCDAQAQSILSPRPQFSMTPPAVMEYQTNNQMEVFAPPESVTHPDKPLFQWGPVGVRPHARYRLLYATALPTSGTNHVEATVQEFSPGVLLNIGSHWSVDYTPTWRFYSSDDFDDTLDHYVRLLWGTTYEDWVFGLMQSYAKTSEPLVETGTQTDQDEYVTTLTASYQFNSKMSLDAAVNQEIISADDFQSSKEWSTLDWLNYQFWQRLDAGVGLGLGYVDVETGADMSYEQLQSRVNWRATDKLSFQVHGGVEFRQFLSGSADDLVNPVAGAMIQYQPFAYTRLSLHGDRTVDAALLTTTGSESQVTETTSVTGHLNQRLFERVFLDLEGGYSNIEYVAADTTTDDRTDDYYTFSARLSCEFLTRGTAAVFYQYGDVTSTEDGYSFSGSQVGFEVEYRF